VCTNYRLAIAGKDALEVWFGELYAFKLVMICFGVLKNRTPFDPE
jgi:hypothetical protein